MPRFNIRSATVVAVALIGSGLASGGCASVTRGADERFTIRSEPSGAIVRLDTGQTGFSPVTFKIPRKGDVIVVVSKENYLTQEVVVKSRLAGGGVAGFLGNAIIGGVVGGAMDIGTGAALSHTPNPLLVVLEPKPAPPTAVSDRRSPPLPTPLSLAP